MSSPDYRYGVFFPRENHPGYLLIRPLSNGAYGQTLLVLSLADGNIYVQKMDWKPSAVTEYEIQSRDVRNHIDHPRVPALIDYQERTYHNTFAWGSIGVKTSSNWEFCNGGTLGSLRNNCLVLTPGTIAELGFQNLAPGFPEVFIWRLWDTLLAVLIAHHRAGISHCDLHDDNIFVHWPLPTTTIPDVYVGDWGNSIQYPWSNHPNRYFSTPFHLNSLSDLARPRSTFTERTLPTFLQPPPAPEEPQPGGFEADDVIKWYKYCHRDMSGVLDHVFNCIVSGAAARLLLDEDTNQYQAMKQASLENRGINGYSAELINAFVLFQNLINQQNQQYQPKDVMKHLHNFHQDIIILRTQAEQRAAADGTDQYNIMPLLQPTLPIARPELWGSPEHLILMNDTDPVIVGPNWIIEKMQSDEFQIRKVTRDFSGNWAVLPVGRWNVDWDAQNRQWAIVDQDRVGQQDQQHQQQQPEDDNDNAILDCSLHDLHEIQRLLQGPPQPFPLQHPVFDQFLPPPLPPAPQSVVPQSVTSEPVVPPPDISQPDISQPDISQPDISQPDISQPVIPKLIASNQVVAQLVPPLSRLPRLIIPQLAAAPAEDQTTVNQLSEIEELCD